MSIIPVFVCNLLDEHKEKMVPFGAPKPASPLPRHFSTFHAPPFRLTLLGHSPYFKVLAQCGAWTICGLLGASN